MAARAAAWLLLLGLALGSARAQEPAPTEQTEPTWYAQALSRSETGLNVTHFWSRGARLRAETVIAGRRAVTIVNGEHYYAYDAVGQAGIAVRRAPAAQAADRAERRPFGHELEKLLEQGAELVREEKLQGRPCDVYRVTDKRGRREVWVTRDVQRLPLRVTIYHRHTGSTQQTDFLNWLSQLSIGPGFFAPEPGVEIEHMELEEFLSRSAKRGGAVGPVPILYADLLHGGRTSRGD